MADLATAEALALLLGLTETAAAAQEDLLELLLEGAEGLFEAETDRSDTPFRTAQTARVEIQEAVTGPKLWLDYPIAAVTAIALGVDVANPSETLDATVATQVVWRVGQRILTRTDGGLWSASGGGAVLSWARGGPLVPDDVEPRPSFVQVTYNAQAELPADATFAVLRLATQLYRQQGTEGIASEQLDKYAVTYTSAATFADAARKDPAWAVAVAKHRRLVAR